jgi:hypothetical protein
MSDLTPMYYIIGPKGFWSTGSAFTSDREQAKQFTYNMAVDFCKRRLGSEPGLACYPVPVATVSEIHRK